MNTCWGSGGVTPHILKLGTLDGGEWSAQILNILCNFFHPPVFQVKIFSSLFLKSLQSTRISYNIESLRNCFLEFVLKARTHTRTSTQNTLNACA